MDDYLRTNRRVYDAMADAGNPLCRPATDAELVNPLGTVDAAGWLGRSIAGKKVLCLAAGGGRQSSLYSAAGADVTVVDISGAMLELDRRVAAERGYRLRLFEASMESLSMLRDGEFDIVIQPVSTCYVPNVAAVFLEVARVCRIGATYISQHKQPTSLQASIDPSPGGGYQLLHRYDQRRGGQRASSQPKRPIPTSQSQSRAAQRLRENGAVEYLHRWEELIGGICRSGFVIEDLTEPVHTRPDAEAGSFADRAAFVPPYVRIKAKRIGVGRDRENETPKVWVPM
jgi:ubiquinone/menaquinone biosynthesis C-methylase UbiE